MGTINAPVTIAAGGSLEAGQAGAGALTLNGNLSFTGAAAINFTAVQGSLNGTGNPALFINGTLATNSNGVMIDGSAATTPFQIVAQTLNGSVNNFNSSDTYVWEIAHSGDANFANLSASQLAQNFVLNTSAVSSATGTSPSSYSLVSIPDASRSELDVVFTPAPEPTSLALAGLGVGGLLLRRRRRGESPRRSDK